jgi:hypothetical protein
MGIALFVTLFLCATLVGGLPWSRDRVAIWVLLGLTCVSLGNLQTAMRDLVRDWAPLLAVLFLYDLGRGFADQAFGRAPIVFAPIRLGDWMFGGTSLVVRLQQHLYHSSTFPNWWDYGAWLVYTTHFFATLGVAAVLWRVRRPLYRRFAMMVATLSAAGFLTYLFLPAVPPWMASEHGHLAPTVRIQTAMWEHVHIVPAVQLFQGGNAYVNDVAALPSLHNAFPLVMLLFFWGGMRWYGRVALGLYVLAMAFTSMYGAEHYFADVLMGWAYAGGTYAVFSAFWRRADRRALLDAAVDARPDGPIELEPVESQLAA